jgi:glycosyltransferase involved in cell wall biosynthesis
MLSVIVPFFNEVDNIPVLHDELEKVLGEIDMPYELLYVDDGSTDGSDEVLDSLTGCTVVHLQRMYGQTAALSAGFAQATGEILATLDGDLQNDPADLPMMVQYMDNNKLDMVTGWRKSRQDGFDKRLPSFIAYLIRQFLLQDGIHDAGCGIKVFRKSVIEGLELYGEKHRFFVSIVKIRGFRVGEVTVNHRPRVKGRSKYSWKRGIKGFLDMIAVAFWGKYSTRPLHMLGGIGLAVIFMSFCIFGVSLLHVFQDFGFLNTQNWVMFSFLTFILGVQLIIFGLIADIAVRGYFAASGKTGYIVREIKKI